MVKADVCQAGRCHHVFDLWGAGFIVRDGQPLFHCQKHAPPILARCAVTMFAAWLLETGCQSLCDKAL